MPTAPALDHEPTEADRRLLRFQGVYPALWKDRTSPLVLSGGAGTAKTLFCLNKILACILRFPGSRALICRKTRESLTQSTLVSFEDKILPAGHHALGNVGRESRASYKFKNGSEIVVGGMQQGGKDNLARIMGTEYDWIYCNELREFEEEHLTDLLSRNRNFKAPFQQIIADTNPWSPSHWIKRGEKTGMLKLVNTTHKDNPFYWNEAKGEWTEAGLSYVEGILAKLPGVKRDRLYLHKWVQAEGVVYEDWDPRVHAIDRMPEGWQAWRKIRVIDFGLRSPFVCLWIAIDYDGRMYVYRQYYFTNRTVATNADAISKYSAGEQYEATISDHAPAEREILRSKGISTRLTKKDKDGGIHRVQDRLALQADGQPRLFVLKDCLVERDQALFDAKLPVCTEDEFEVYCWKKNAEGKAIKDEPEDRDDHAMDCLAYGSTYVDRFAGAIEDPQLAEGRVKERADSLEQAHHDFWLSPENPAMWPDEFDE